MHVKFILQESEFGIYVIASYKQAAEQGLYQWPGTPFLLDFILKIHVYPII